eukprot:scaffold35122_cov17-Tisochrysis_lutea.AAC.1
MVVDCPKNVHASFCNFPVQLCALHALRIKKHSRAVIWRVHYASLGTLTLSLLSSGAPKTPESPPDSTYPMYMRACRCCVLACGLCFPGHTRPIVAQQWGTRCSRQLAPRNHLKRQREWRCQWRSSLCGCKAHVPQTQVEEMFCSQASMTIPGTTNVTQLLPRWPKVLACGARGTLVAGIQKAAAQRLGLSLLGKCHQANNEDITQ